MIHDHEDDERPAEKFLGGRVLLPPGTDSKIAIRSWSKSDSLSDENVSISVNNEQYLISDRAMTEADTPNQPLDDDTILVLQGLLFSRRPTWTRNESRALSNIQLKHYEMLDREA